MNQAISLEQENEKAFEFFSPYTPHQHHGEHTDEADEAAVEAVWRSARPNFDIQQGMWYLAKPLRRRLD